MAASINSQWRVKPAIEAPRGGVWLGAGSPEGDGVLLGSLAETVTGKSPQVWLSTGKEHVTAIVGKRGSGKSFTLGVVVEGLVSGPNTTLGRQSSLRAALLFDPLDIYWTLRYPVAASENAEANRHYLLARSGGLIGPDFSVQAWVPGSANRRPSDPDWFNTLMLPVTQMGLEEWELLLDVRIMTDPMGQAFTDCLTLASSAGYSIGTERVEPKESFDLNDLAASIRANEMTSTYHAETLRALRQRLASLHATGLFSSTGTEIGQLLSPGQASVVLLNRLPQSHREAVVSVITRMLIDARSSAAFAEKRLALDPELSDESRIALLESAANGVPKTVVVLDEAQSFLSPGSRSSARDLFVRLVKEGRNMGLSAVLATQQPSAIDTRILSQVETFISHQLVTEQDIRSVRDNLKSSLPSGIQFGSTALDISEFLRQLPPGVCLVSAADMNTTIRRSLVVSVRARATVHGGIEL